MERDKFLTEAMGGKKEHACVVEGDLIFDCVMDEDHDETWSSCIYGRENGKREYCNEWQEVFVDGVIDFSTWQGFGKLWEWAQDKEWWIKFVGLAVDENKCKIGKVFTSGEFLHSDIINPDLFANAVYEFLKEAK